jgi:hypothetical protein
LQLLVGLSDVFITSNLALILSIAFGNVLKCIGISLAFPLAQDMTFHFAKSLHMSLNSSKFVKGLLPISGKVPVFIHSFIHSLDPLVS